MKNTLYFDDAFDVILLENEEDDTNSIYLVITTGEATNPVLHIESGSTSASVSLIEEATNTIELASDYWAEDGDTLLWLTTDDETSEDITITFPEVISTDAMVYETDSRAYAMQGQSSEALDLKTQVVTYTNARDYTIGDSRKRVVILKYICGVSDSNGLFQTTINFTASGITDTAVVTARLRVDGELIPLFIPAQTVSNGQHVLTITYPVLSLTKNIQGEIDVYLSIDDGTITITQGQIWASMIASGLAVSTKWNGEIEISDEITVLSLQSMTMAGMTDTISIAQQTPAGATIAQTIGGFAIGRITLAGVSDAVTFRAWASELTWTELSAMTWDTLYQEYIWGRPTE